MYQVISEFTDKKTGRRVKPGETFAPADNAQAERLVRARCLVHAGGAVKAREPKPAADSTPAPFFPAPPSEAKPVESRTFGAGKRKKRR